MLSIDPGDDPGSFLPGDQPPVPAEGAPAGEDRQAGHAVILPRARSRTLCPCRRWRTAARSSGPGPSPGAARGTAGSAAVIRRTALFLVRGDRAGPGRGRREPRRSCPACSPSSPPPGCGSRCPTGSGRSPTGPRCGSRSSATRATEFVPCFTSVQRLTAWADPADAATQRAGDARTVPHRRGAGRGPGRAAARGRRARAQPRQRPRPAALPGVRAVPGQASRLSRAGARGSGPGTDACCPGPAPVLIGHPPGEPTTLLAEARAVARRAARRPRWPPGRGCRVPGEGAGLVIAVASTTRPAAGPRAALGGDRARGRGGRPARPVRARRHLHRRAAPGARLPRRKPRGRARGAGHEPRRRAPAATRSTRGSRATPARSTSAPSQACRAPHQRRAAAHHGQSACAIQRAPTGAQSIPHHRR